MRGSGALLFAIILLYLPAMAITHIFESYFFDDDESRWPEVPNGARNTTPEMTLRWGRRPKSSKWQPSYYPNASQSYVEADALALDLMAEEEEGWSLVPKVMPAWFDNRTMRVITEENHQSLYLGYASIHPQRPLTDYRKKDDPDLPLGQRINHGLRLPNRYRPGEWAPLRNLFPAPITHTDDNGVVFSTRAKQGPVSWFSVAQGSIGNLETVERKFEQEFKWAGFRMTPEDWDDENGPLALDDVTSPLTFFRTLAWWLVCLLPPNWVQYPYLPWSPRRPFKLSLSDLPGRQMDTTNMYFHHPDMRPAPSTMHPLWKKFFRKDKGITVRSLTDRDKDISADWPIWSVGVKKLQNIYKEKETMVVLQGSATVKPSNDPKAKPIHIKKGDLVHFPQDMVVDWDVKEHFMAHYMFHTN